MELCDGFDVTSHLVDRERALAVYQQYTTEKRIERFQQYSGLQPGAKIFMVSDYIVDMGGIEHLLLNMQRLLMQA